MEILRKIYFGMHKCSNLICRILEFIIILLVVVNAGDVFLQVFNRYVLVKISNISFSWTDEMARYSMIWICYCAVGICFREGSMAQVDIIYNRLNKRGRLALYCFWYCLFLSNTEFMYVVSKRSSKAPCFGHRGLLCTVLRLPVRFW